ncbi:MAG TPA: hypothetical protein VIX87_09200 [Steroidobacteraceae bacterium]
MRFRRNLIVAALALASTLLLGAQAGAAVSVGISVNIAPPELPVYTQPPVPGPGYIWTPGYWAYGDDGYYWVPGTWVTAPQPGYLWTPGYWGWSEGAYLWHGGYWGPHVGFYGGVNYGFGYIGTGYAGGYWRGGAFFYNRSVNNIPGSVHITNVYNRTVVNNISVRRVSFNGGSGGIDAHPTAGDLAAEHERHLAPIGDQLRHEQAARGNPSLRAATNHGVPPIAATARPAMFSGPGVVHARGAGPAHPGPTHAGPPHAAESHAGPPHATPHATESHVEPQHAGPPHATESHAEPPHAGPPHAAESHGGAPGHPAAAPKQEHQPAEHGQEHEHEHEH